MKSLTLIWALLTSLSALAQISSVSPGQAIQAGKLNEVIESVNQLSSQDALTKINLLIAEVDKLKAQNVLVVAKTSGSPTATFSQNTTSIFKYPSTSKDTHSGYSPVTGLYTVKVEGWYRVHVQQQININVTAGNAFGLQILRNSGDIAFPFLRSTGSINSNMNLTASGSSYFMVGDTIGARAYVEGGGSSVGQAGDFMLIERLPSAPSL